LLEAEQLNSQDLKNSCLFKGQRVQQVSNGGTFFVR
jgi:hypothetical protein